MKILSGKWRGRPIVLATSPEMRPTSDMARKAIFNALQGGLEGRRVLDVFGGTGALGFEALSLGAAEVVWIEMDRAQAKMIERTAGLLKVGPPSRVITADALAALRRLDGEGESFDFIFLDPPYHAGLGVPAVSLIASSGLLRPGAIIVLETHKTEDPPETIGVLRSVKTLRHGDTKITFYRQE